MKTILIKKKKYDPATGMFLPTYPDQQPVYYTYEEIEELRAEGRIANGGFVLEKGKTRRADTLYLLCGHNPAAWLKTILQKRGVTIKEASRVLGVGIRTMQRWCTPGSGAEIPPHLMDMLDQWPNYRNQGGTVEGFREELRAEGHPAFNSEDRY